MTTPPPQGRPSWGRQQPPQAGWGVTPPAPGKKGAAKKGCLGCAGTLGLVAIVGIAFSVASSKSTGSSSSAAKAPAAGSAAGQQQPAAPASVAPAPAKTVTYVVTGASDADIQYGPAGSNTQGHAPMSVTKPLDKALYYAISAQLQGSGDVTCQLEVNGTVISQATASGGYDIASCEISQDPLTGDWKDTNRG